MNREVEKGRGFDFILVSDMQDELDSICNGRSSCECEVIVGLL